MSSVVTYQNTDRRCFCQIRFTSGERVLISIATSPMPTVKIIRMGFGGLLPRGAIWEYKATMAGTADAYAQNLMKMFPPDSGRPVHPLDLIRDALLSCCSIDECRRALASREGRISLPGPDILRLYADLLQRAGMIEPVSSLPAPKREIKAALIAEARRLSAESKYEAVEMVRTCYSLLASFVSDDIAARNRGSVPGCDLVAGFAEINGLRPEDLRATSEEAERLIQEFDSHLARHSNDTGTI